MSIALSPMMSQDLHALVASTSPRMASGLDTGPPSGDYGRAKMDDHGQRYEKPPPLHTGADWKIVLHLPEIETWLRGTTRRVQDLTYSVQQDSENRHVDAHLVQLKDICEDISDHVEQIHALLETEFSLKLLSYSVSVIVDIHSVQLLWHQLRVSVLVLRERILRGLQDSNGNYTRQTDILQAFSAEPTEDRLDALTEVDDSGQLTIRCSQTYLSLDCGITAFELSDYSPSEELINGGVGEVAPGLERAPDLWACTEMEQDVPDLVKNVGLLTVVTNPAEVEVHDKPLAKGSETPTSAGGGSANKSIEDSGTSSVLPSLPVGSFLGVDRAPHVKGGLAAEADALWSLVANQQCSTPLSVEPHCRTSHHCESAPPKRPIRDCFNYTEDSPTQPTMPKRGLFLEDVEVSERRTKTTGRTASSLLALKTELSRSSPSLLDVPDRSKLCLPLKASYCNGPSGISQSYDCLFRTGDQRLEEKPKKSHKATNPHPGEHAACGRPNGKVRQKALDGKEGATCQKRTSVPDSTPSWQESSHRGRELVPAAVPSWTYQLVDGQDVVPTPVPRDLPASPSHNKLEKAVIPPSSLRSWSSEDSGTWNCSPPALQDGGAKDGSSSVSGESTTGKQVGAWYGSDEYLALPSHLKQTEVLALKLENLARLVPPSSTGEAIQNIDDWELSEMNSDSEMYPIFPLRKKQHRLGRVSPSSSSDMAPSLDDSIESGPLSDIFSDEDIFVPSPGPKRCDASSLDHTPNHLGLPTASKTSLIQQLVQDIRHQDNYEAVWDKIEGFVGQLDEFIRWMQEAMATTENWIPPKAETDRLKLYLETHLSFKLNVESHRTLKDSVTEEGRQLLELMVSHKSGLKDMLHMIGSQWKELQRQIKRQHSWILLALDAIKAEILATDVSAEDVAVEGSPEAEVQLCSLEAKRDAVDQMSLKLFSEQYARSSKRKEEFADMSKGSTAGNNGLLDFDSEYQEIWDWLIDMESTVMDRHGLMMSEDQQQHLYKRYSVEMTIREPKIRELLGKIAALSRSGPPLPGDVLQRVDLIREKWDLLGTALGVKILGAVPGPCDQGPRELLSPESGSRVKQLEVRIKELKGWLRDTELFIFNSCLRREKEGAVDTERQVQHFKTLCAEIKLRRRDIASILRLCQHLLEDQETCHLDADHQSMQLIIVNLERRWEAIIMQAMQWQSRLQKKLGREQETQGLLDSDWMDLNGTGEDDWEWDETDFHPKMIGEDSSDGNEKTHPAVPRLEVEASNDSETKEDGVVDPASSLCGPRVPAPFAPPVYQVYSLHNVELFDKHQQPFLQKPLVALHPKSLSYLQKSLNQDSSFSSTKSLPELLGGIAWTPLEQTIQRGSVSRHSECESGIASEGDTETAASSEACLLLDGEGTCAMQADRAETPCIQERPQPAHQTGENDGVEGLGTCHPRSALCWMKNKTEDFDRTTELAPQASEEGLQAKRDLLTFYDYSYLQSSSKLQLPTIATPSQASDSTGTSPATQQGLYHDTIKHQLNHSNLKSNAIMLPLSPDDPDHNSVEGVKKWITQQEGKQMPSFSSGSSLESISPAGDLLGSRTFRSSDCLQRSTSLESWLVSYKSNEDLFSGHGSADNSLSSDSVGELSKRTLDLLKRLEDIESPSDQKIKRSISDITLQSSSHKMSITGQHSLDIASSVNEDSASSLTELSSSEEISLCSEDIIVQKHTIPDSNASFRKHLTRSLAEESDANVSMIVNVSCTSACTDDEDDSDLLSSSTLTLTEDELGMKDEEDEVSSIATDEDIHDESGLMSGIEYIKNELQTWIRPKFMLPPDKKRASPCKALKCGKWGSSNRMMAVAEALSIEEILKGSAQKVSQDFSQRKQVTINEELACRNPLKDNSQVSKDTLVDDVENGNVESVQEQLGEELRRSQGPGVKDSVAEQNPDKESHVPEQQKHISAPKEHKLGVSWRSLSPRVTRDLQKDCEGGRHCDQKAYCPSVTKSWYVPSLEAGGQDMQTAQSQATVPDGQPGRTDLLDKPYDGCTASTDRDTSGSPDSCCHGHSTLSEEPMEDDSSVHDFVKEIIGMASTALKNKSQSESEVASPSSLSKIREKVLEHSHRSLQLRKGDFYSYLSLSSHDSDCGEVSSYAEDKSSTPVPSDDNIECFFEACTEDEPSAQEPISPDCNVETSAAENGAPAWSQESKASIECIAPSPLSVQPDLEASWSPSQQVPGTSKGEPASFQEHIECHSTDSAWGGPRGGVMEEPFYSRRPKSSDAGPTGAIALDLRFTPSYSRRKERPHHDTQTLMCASTLHHLHQEAPHHTNAVGNHFPQPASTYVKEPESPSNTGTSFKTRDNL
ncbi:A-kinase anchor protein 6 [Pleurodeles waltl]|uniref:A-kinase anchor protein 6 n=1 Tax=Pleurodeles waltl TaxID=8319 RepID=UPI0037097331